MNNTALDEVTLKPMIEDVLAQRKRQKANELIRGQYAISYDEMLKTGRERLPESLFRDAMASVRDIQIDADFIIAGFSGHHPVLIETDRLGRAHIREDFAVIGEGAYLAQSVLMHRKYTDVNGLAEALYIVYEAKRYAEGSSTVGKWSTFEMMTPDGRRSPLSDDGRDWLQKSYAQFGPKDLNVSVPEGVRVFGKADQD